jgi:hypothetical protein
MGGKLYLPGTYLCMPDPKLSRENWLFHNYVRPYVDDAILFVHS